MMCGSKERERRKWHRQAEHSFSSNRLFSEFGWGKAQQEPAPAAGTGPGIAGWVCKASFCYQQTQGSLPAPFYSQLSGSSGRCGDAQGATPSGHCRESFQGWHMNPSTTSATQDPLGAAPAAPANSLS